MERANGAPPDGRKCQVKKGAELSLVERRRKKGRSWQPVEVGGALDTWLPPIIIAGLLPTPSPASCHGWLALTPLHFLNDSPEPPVATVQLSLTRRLQDLPECRQPSAMMGSVSACVDSGFPLDLLNHVAR